MKKYLECENYKIYLEESNIYRFVAFKDNYLYLFGLKEGTAFGIKIDLIEIGFSELDEAEKYFFIVLYLDYLCNKDVDIDL